MKTLNEIRAAYLKHMEEHGHAIIPSASLVPENDPTTLFTGSGMQPLVPYLLGREHPKGSRLADSQKSFRSGDIEEIGDNRHTTFFEMLGNWSLGDYFKKEQLRFFFEFLTKKVELDPSKLYVTVFIGDEKNNVPRDTESVAIWKELFKEKGIDALDAEMGSEANGYIRGMKEGERIFYYDAKKNWWSRAGVPENMPVGELGGPDSEVFYDFGTPHDPKWGAHCHPNCDCGRFLEIGNSVFMQYLKQEDGSFGLLPKQNVDFGGGLERITAAKNGNPDVFTIDAFQPIISFIESKTGKKYTEDGEVTRAFRVIADHMRAAVFLIADGVLPANADQGYFVRRLIRRAVRYADKLGMTESGLAGVVGAITATYQEQYPEVAEKKDMVESAVRDEEERFRNTLSSGLKALQSIGFFEFDQSIDGKITRHGDPRPEDLFELYTTHGFPPEMVMEELLKREDHYLEGGVMKHPYLTKGRQDELMSGFRALMEKHQELSRAGAEQKFKGGLADASVATTRLHTAHHLLLKALQVVLGNHVKQRGSNITGERLRIDFSHGEKMTPEQIAEVEKIVNEKIQEALPVTVSTLPKEEAEKIGAEHEFGAKYPDMVTVYSVGPKTATVENPDFAHAFSIEFCGGPHVTNTSELGTFKIQKEEASSAGIRRIKATLL